MIGYLANAGSSISICLANVLPIYLCSRLFHPILSKFIAIIIQILGFGEGHAATTASSLAMTYFGIPLTGSMSAGFIISWKE